MMIQEAKNIGLNETYNNPQTSIIHIPEKFEVSGVYHVTYIFCGRKVTGHGWFSLLLQYIDPTKTFSYYSAK